ncbi:MAG: DNA polymerase III subunit delta' C-terminal domain-containing protein [Balneolaceae bacterium]
MSLTETFGEPGLIGQKRTRDLLARSLTSGRLNHAWLFTGPEGSGKTAFALAFAEAINGITHLNREAREPASSKSSWFSHPDIHLFMPLPKTVSESDGQRTGELISRARLLLENPYERVDFRQRPLLDKESGSLNRQAFYSTDYFNDVIRKRVYLKPNEGEYTVVILTGIETMREVAANAFLKILEEPPDKVIFLLTADRTDLLLPTILSRCRMARLSPLSENEVVRALTERDGMNLDDAKLLTRMTGGNYSLARHYDLEQLKRSRSELIEFLRNAYSQQADIIVKQVQEWQSSLNTENQIVLADNLELFLRDLLVWSETGEVSLISNSDQAEVIQKFCNTLSSARLPEMIEDLRDMKPLLYQNVPFKYIFTVLSIRYSYLMRGKDPVIPKNEAWRHLPALHTEL